MRKLIASATIAALICVTVVGPAESAVPPSAGNVAAVDSNVQQLFASYPNGGPELTNQLVNLIVAKPSIGPELVAYTRSSTTLSAGQKAAAEQAYQQALHQLGTGTTLGHAKWGFIILAAALAGVIIYATNNDNDNGHRHKVSPN